MKQKLTAQMRSVLRAASSKANPKTAFGHTEKKLKPRPITLAKAATAGQRKSGKWWSEK